MSIALLGGSIHSLRKCRSTISAAVMYILVFIAVNGLSVNAFSYFNVKTTLDSGETLALAAMGQTFVILTGGFDLSAGAVISLVNVFVGSTMTDSISNQVVVGLLGVGIGGMIGGVNGALVSFLRMQPIVVTLSTLFIVQGAALLVMPTPGGYVSPSFVNFFSGAALPKLIPSSAIVLAVAIIIWRLIRNSRFGLAIYAIGGDEGAASAAGVKDRRTKFFAYVVGGCFYGASGIFLSAQSGGSDPLVGQPMLLQVFAAVVLGGTPLGGGRGGAIGSAIGAYLLMLFINILLVFNLPAYLAPIADGCVLISAVLLGMIGARDSFIQNIVDVFRRSRGAVLERQRQRRDQHLWHTQAITGLPQQAPTISWISRRRDAIQSAMPSYIAFAFVVLVTWSYIGSLSIGYFRSLLVLSAFLGILAFGQTVVVLSGGLDLSIPWLVTLAGCLFAGWASGSNGSLLWVVPLVLICGVGVGAINGIGVAVLGLPPIVMTLAVNGILQGLALFYTKGSPSGLAPSLITWMTNGSLLRVTPIIWMFAVFAIIGVVFLAFSHLGRRIYAVGNSPLVADLSGISVRSTLIIAYSISGFCAALVGILLIGFNGAPNLSLGDEYLLPSIAVVVAGGVLITGGRGHYIGVLGGVLLLIALQVLITGTMLPDAARSIIFGLVLLSALLALRQRQLA